MIERRTTKARSTRKHGIQPEIRHAKPARRGQGRRGARVVKPRRASLPGPANDTTLGPLDRPALEGGPLNEIMAAELEPEAAQAAPPPSAGESERAEDEDIGGEMVAAEEAAATAAPEAGRDEEEDDEDGREDDDEEEQEAEGGEARDPQSVESTPTVKKRRSEDEPSSFLAMYFRDMAALDVLRPEQEFETARVIEEMELDLWRTLLGFAPGASWMADTVELAVGKPVPEMKAYRARGERARKKASIPERTRFEKAAAEVAAKLRVADIDRLFMEAAVHEVQRVARGPQGAPAERRVAFSTSTKAFREYGKSVRRKAFALKAAKNEFVKANLRLVVSIARRFNHGRLPLADLIQEGNIGLMKAVERYDYRRGFRFSTYASWWIRHAISRALADKGRAVRLPVHMIDAYHRIAKSQRELQSKLERPPTTQEVADATGIEADKLEKMKTFLSETPVSLDRNISDEDGRRLIDVLVDPNEGPSISEQMASTETQSEMLTLLGDLKPIEADILRKRFGLVNERERTLKEIGDEYSLSRERVRQLQEQALGKMRRAMAKREML